MSNLIETITALGYIAIAFTVFAESGLLFGFFLPGDSLLFTVGVLVSQGIFKIHLLVPLIVVSAILGDSVGYWFGHKFGPRVFSRDDSLFFRKTHVEKTSAFFARYGKKTIILARFVPIVRTFAPVMAGVGSMHYPTFLAYNIVGGVLWGAGLPLLGFWLGFTLPWVEEYLTYIILAIIVVSFIPVFLELYGHWRSRANRPAAATSTGPELP